MGRAIDDRNQWRDMVAVGIVSEEMRRAVELYRAYRDDPLWRASRYSEIMGEIASAWLAAVDAGMMTQRTSVPPAE